MRCFPVRKTPFEKEGLFILREKDLEREVMVAAMDVMVAPRQRTGHPP
jgi:hypothetical protein